MAKFTMLFLYIAGFLLFLISLLVMIASFANPNITFGRAFAGMVMSAMIMALGAILQVLREIAANTSRDHRGQ